MENQNENKQSTNRILSEAEKLGFHQLKGVDVYATVGEKGKGNAEKVTEGPVQHKETDYLLRKSYVCPICNNSFKALQVKASKPRLLSTDPDMRPVYQYIDVIKYDCVVCEKCGYASLNKHFDQISDAQIRIVRKEVCERFKGLKPAGDTYTYDEAITRFQLALANTMIKRAKASERAYLCLKLAWLYRGKRNAIVSIDEKKREELYETEIQYIKKAREGFLSARAKEMFPIAGMDEYTFDFLLAELSIECNEEAEAKKLISNLIYSKTAPTRVRDKARELRDFLNEREIR